MDPPIGNGFRLQQPIRLLKINAIIKSSAMSTSKSKTFLRFKNRNIIKVSSLTTHTENASKPSPAYLSSPLWLRPPYCNRYHLTSYNLSFIILNNFAGFLPTTQASASAQRENTRILPLQTGGLADGGRIGFGNSSGIHGGILSSIATPNVPCYPGLFRCNNGKCITSLWVCNYQKDCEGGEDAQQSFPPPECEPGQINCGQYVFNKTYCIPPHFRCGMTEDCEDKADETQCNK